MTETGPITGSGDGAEERGASGETGTRKRTKRRGPLHEVWVIVRPILFSLILISLCQAFVFRLYAVPSGSMENTLQVGDRIGVNRMAYLGGEPTNGDVVVFRAADRWENPEPEDGNPLKQGIRYFGDVTGIGPSHSEYLVKRVVAVGGQTVECCSVEGKLLVDGKAVDEPYIFEDFQFVSTQLDCTSTPASPRCFPPFTVPEGEVVVLGDHRSNSADSVRDCRLQQAISVGAESCVRTVKVEDVMGKVSVRLWPLNQLQTNF